LLGLFLQSRRDDGHVDATPPAASPAASVSATTSAPGASTPTTLPAAPAPIPPPPSSAATPSVAATPRATSSATTSAPPPTPVSGTPRATDLAGAVSGYYAQLPGGTDQTWPLMTANYQNKTAGGRQAYQRFWDQYSRVTATDVTATGPSAVQATITYYAKSGRVIRERTSFTLVNDGGVLKIDGSRVLTSTG
ncbi:MAG: hypothetical protein M3Z83_01005, partial [Actinomycetota bacterium]|nr:hypothetical protein [Actinomycetota bacterium]